MDYLVKFIICLADGTWDETVVKVQNCPFKTYHWFGPEANLPAYAESWVRGNYPPDAFRAEVSHWFYNGLAEQVNDKPLTTEDKYHKLLLLADAASKGSKLHIDRLYRYVGELEDLGDLERAKDDS